MTKEQVLESLRAWVLAYKAEMERPWTPEDRSLRGGTVKVEWMVNTPAVSYGHPSPYHIGIDLTRKDEGKLRWALHKLNVEGLVTQPSLTRRGKVYYVKADIPEKPRVSLPQVASDIDHPEGVMAIWNERPFTGRPRFSKRLQCRVKAAAVLMVLIMLSGCATPPPTPPPKPRKPLRDLGLDAISRTLGIPGIPEQRVVEPGPKGFYRIPMYDENGDRMWLMIPYGSEVQSLMWETP